MTEAGRMHGAFRAHTSRGVLSEAQWHKDSDDTGGKNSLEHHPRKRQKSLKRDQSGLIREGLMWTP